MNTERHIWTTICMPVLLLSMSFAGRGLAQPGDAPEQVRLQVESLVRSGAYDRSIGKAIQALNDGEQLRLSGLLATSGNPASRKTALRILVQLPGELVEDKIRELARDHVADIRMEAAGWLVANSDDDEAWEMLMAGAVSDDRDTAIESVKALSALQGDRIETALISIIENDDVLPATIVTAMHAVARRRSQSFALPLAGRLRDTRSRGLFRGDTVRLCDIAAASLEQIYRTNYTGIRDLYETGTIEQRDGGIATWLAWFAEHGHDAPIPAWETTVLTTAQTVVGRLTADTPPAESDERLRLAGQLRSVLGIACCLGQLEGVDRIVAPSVDDLARILHVHGRKEGNRFLNEWNSLDTAFMRQFMPNRDKQPSSPESDAVDFIEFVKGLEPVPELWLWSFCRDYLSAFQAGSRQARVRTIMAELEDRFRTQRRRQVVLHGRIAVLEPIPHDAKPSGPGDMVPDGGTASAHLIAQYPSDWSLHRREIERFRRMGGDFDVYPNFTNHARLYPGSEWPFIADAAYQTGVRSNHAAALVQANKALVLNPRNPKAYTVRAAAFLAAGDKDRALDDVMTAYRLDPAALGDEPETFRLLTLLIRHASQGDRHPLLEAVGALRAYGRQRTFAEVLASGEDQTGD